jgi:hypothetical protein
MCSSWNDRIQQSRVIGMQRMKTDFSRGSPNSCEHSCAMKIKYPAHPPMHEMVVANLITTAHWPTPRYSAAISAQWITEHNQY